MFSVQYILSLFKGNKSVQIVYFFLAVSILQVADLFLTIYLTQMFGEYLIMAVICLVSLLGLLFSVLKLKDLTKMIKIECDKGQFPEESFYEMTGLYLAAWLIFIPGFATSLIGIMLLLPFFSKIAGRIISSRTSTDWHTVYEYMKI